MLMARDLPRITKGGRLADAAIGSIGGAIGAAAQDAVTGIPSRDEDEALREEAEYREAQATDDPDDDASASSDEVGGRHE